MSQKIVRLHHNVALDGGVLSKLNASSPSTAWGYNALQTISVTRHTPFNPQQAIGYKGIVDYTSSPVTSDVTLDCILTENCYAASTDTSVYNHAEGEVEIGVESYVLTSCAMNFQAGNPATINFGYITASEASSILANTSPDVLKAGEEAAFAVIMGEDGTGIAIVVANASGTAMVLPAGVQTLGFNCSLNRNQILDVRKSSPVQFITTYPLDITMNMEMLQSMNLVDAYGATQDANVLAKNLNSLTVQAGASTQAQGIVSAPTGHPVGSSPNNPLGVNTAAGKDTPNANVAASGKKYVIASGLKKTEDGENIGVGGNLTFTYNFSAADLDIPLEYTGSNSEDDGGGE